MRSQKTRLFHLQESVWLAFLEPADISAIAQTCKYFHQFSRQDNVWLNQYHSTFPKQFRQQFTSTPIKWYEEFKKTSLMKRYHSNTQDLPGSIRAHQLFLAVKRGDISTLRKMQLTIDGVIAPYFYIKD